MNLILLGTSFLAGILTILAPCVLPLLPVIIGATAGSQNKWKPLIVTTSLALSIVVFTILLKASSLLINIPQSFWTGLSGGIIFVFGIFLLIPKIWENIAFKSKLSQTSQSQLEHAGAGESIGSTILIGAALGPVFSSCSPTYFVILATVLPVSFFTGLSYLFAYAFGIMISLGLVAMFGQRLISKLGWATNPHGWFKKTMGVLLVIVGLSIMTGLEKKLELAILKTGFGSTKFEQKLLEKTIIDKDIKIEPTVNTGTLPYLYNAPELVGLTNWINSKPINSLAELKGKVVLIDFWTYSCINCIRTLPYLRAWHKKYADQGLVIIGAHAPEFQFEKKFENVQQAVKDFNLPYAIAQDNDFLLWRAYRNRYWPAKYLIDREGFVRYTHFGEGEYVETELAITSLLEVPIKLMDVTATPVVFEKIETRETYVGLERRENYSDNYADLNSNEWSLKGQWKEDAEKAINESAGAGIKMKFKASRANLVMSGFGLAEVYIDGKIANTENSGKDVKDGKLILDGDRLYELTDFGEDYSEHEIEVIFLQIDISLYAWTFG